MKNLENIANPYNDGKVLSSCSLFGMMSVEGNTFNGEDIMKSMANMRVRGNGLGGGFAAYGIYPDFADKYALHIMANTRAAKKELESFIGRSFTIAHDEEVPTRSIPEVSDPPILWRYFIEPKAKKNHDDIMLQTVMHINTQIADTFVFSSGKNLGVFKGVGFPEDVGRFFRLEDYKGYMWTSHSRFPTNTQGWWGGAHPFSVLDQTVVHNGEISSYDANRRFLEMYDYRCTMHTDTEVVIYGVDLLLRRHKLPVNIMAKVFAPPTWDIIDRMPQNESALYSRIRQVYGPLMLNGPFSFIIAREGEMIGLTDRIRLRPLTVGTKGDMFYLSSEEAAIRLIEPNLDKAWIPKGGEPIIGRLRDKKVTYNTCTDLGVKVKC